MDTKQDITATGMPLIDSVVERLCHETSLSTVWHRSGQGAPMPSLPVLSEILERLRAAIFPGYFGPASVRRESMRYHLSANLDSIHRLLGEQIVRGFCFSCEGLGIPCTSCETEGQHAALAFMDSLPEIRRLLAGDAKAAYEGDPAATSPGETIFCYPSLRAMIIGIVAIALAGMMLGVSQVPQGNIFNASLPLPTETFMAMDLKGALHHGLISIIFTLTMVDLFDNMGVLIGLSQKAGFIREDGHIENLDKALISDSIATMSSAVLGATTATSYLESAAGVAEGGRTGLTAVTIAVLFFLTLFFAPLVSMVPAYATAPVLIIVGAMMMQEVGRIKFKDFTVALPAFLTIISMPLTFNIATGFGFGFVSWVGLKALSGRFKDINLVMLLIALCFVINFALRLQ